MEFKYNQLLTCAMQGRTKWIFFKKIIIIFFNIEYIVFYVKI